MRRFSRALFLTDLDGTLFQTKNADQAGIHPMSEWSDGCVQGLATEAQAELWDGIRHFSNCIPVTARDVEQMRLVTGWNALQRHQLALVNHGMTLLYRDTQRSYSWEVIELWSHYYALQAESYQKVLDTTGTELMFEILKAVPKITEFKTRISNERLPGCGATKMYVTFQARDFMVWARLSRDQELVAKLRGAIYNVMNRAPVPFRYFEQDFLFSLLPEYVNKGAAAQRLLGMINGDEVGFHDERLELALCEIQKPSLVMTAGSAFEDVEFMGLGHFMITPQGSGLARALEQGAQEHLRTDIPVLAAEAAASS